MSSTVKELTNSRRRIRHNDPIIGESKPSRLVTVFFEFLHPSDWMLCQRLRGEQETTWREFSGGWQISDIKSLANERFCWIGFLKKQFLERVFNSCARDHVNSAGPTRVPLKLKGSQRTAESEMRDVVQTRHVSQFLGRALSNYREGDHLSSKYNLCLITWRAPIAINSLSN